MTSFEKTISLFNAGLFFYLLFCLFVCFSYFSQGQSGAALSAEKLRYPAGMIVGSPCTVSTYVALQKRKENGKPCLTSVTIS